MTRTKLSIIVCGLAACLLLAGCGRSERRAARAKSQQAKSATTKSAATTLKEAPTTKAVPAKKEEKPSLPPIWSATFTGYGAHQDQAVQHAVKQAQDELAKFLPRQQPSITWKPPLDFVQRRMAGDAVRNVEKEKDLAEALKKEGKELPLYECWDVPFRLTPSVYSEILHENARHRAQEQQYERDARRSQRLLQEAKIVGGLLLLLLTLVGYLRLDRWTEGKCTRVLRFTLLGLLVVGTMGLWFFFG